MRKYLVGNKGSATHVFHMCTTVTRIVARLLSENLSNENEIKRDHLLLYFAVDIVQGQDSSKIPFPAAATGMLCISAFYHVLHIINESRTQAFSDE